MNHLIEVQPELKGISLFISEYSSCPFLEDDDTHDASKKHRALLKVCTLQQATTPPLHRLAVNLQLATAIRGYHRVERP